MGTTVRRSRLVRRTSTAIVVVFMAPVSGYSAVLDELIVTATKREVAAREVPLSMEVRAGDEIYRDRFLSLEELSARLPNLVIGDGIANTNVAIRGIGAGNDRSLEQAVGLFVDGVYMPRSRQYRTPFLDVERVEVLRGPQASLFGINSTAGAIEVVTKRSRPGEGFDGHVGVEYETEYGGTALTAIGGGPLGGNVGVRGALRYVDSGDGYYVNRSTGRDENATEQTLARFSIVWMPLARLSIDAAYEFADFDTDGHVGELFGADAAAVGNDGTLNWSRAMDGGLLPSLPGSPAAGLASQAHNLRLAIDYEVGEHALTLLTGYVDNDWKLYTDLDGTPVTIIDAGIREDYEQASIEFRVTSPTGRPLDYVVGALFLDATLDSEQPALVDGTVFLADAGFPVPGFENSRESVFNWFGQDQQTWSVFGSATWHITDEFRLTGGARYNSEEKDYTREGECLALRDDGRLEPPDPANNPNDFLLFTFVNFCPTLSGTQRSRTSRNLMPELVLQWSANERVMLYGRVAGSAKSGGFSGATIVAEEFLEYDDEQARHVELGVKAGLAGGAAELNLALFRTEVDDLQVNSFDEATVSAVLTNAAEARSQGIELQGRWATSSWLSVGASLAWLDAEFESFPRGPCAPSISDDDFCDLTGKRLPYAPEYSATGYGNVEFPVTSTIVIDGRLTVSYTDDYFTEGSLDPVGVQPSYTLVDGRIGIGAADRRWSVALVGKNLTDEAVLNVSQPLLGNYIGFVQAPRTAAIQVDLRFGN